MPSQLPLPTKHKVRNSTAVALAFRNLYSLEYTLVMQCSTFEALLTFCPFPGYSGLSQAGTPSPLGTGDSSQSEKSAAAAAAAYAQLNQLNAAQIG